MSLNVFDLVVLLVLIAGILCGRKRGMSAELLSLLQWIAILIGCGLLYRPLGSMFASSSRLLSLLTCYLLAYAVAAMVIVSLFGLVKKGLGGKLLGSDMFGGSEYYLGMGAGLLRFGCILLVVLAIINARGYDAAEVRAMELYQQKEYGSTYFPTLHTVQATVFEKSMSGPWIRDHLGFLLITPTKPENKEIKRKEFTLPD
jgi:uncharacterized membrane protein required for colicin V production